MIASGEGNALIASGEGNALTTSGAGVASAARSSHGERRNRAAKGPIRHVGRAGSGAGGEVELDHRVGGEPGLDQTGALQDRDGAGHLLLVERADGSLGV